MHLPPSTVMVRRAQPWFGQYVLCGHSRVRGAYALRGLDHDHINLMMTWNKDWDQLQVNHGGSWRARLRSDGNTPADLHALCDFLLAEPDRKVVVQSDRLSVYTNNRMFLERLARFPIGQFQWISEVLLEGEPGAVNLRSSDWQWRSYLRTQKIDSNTRTSLRCYLDNQSDLRIGPALRHALDHEFLRLHEYHFIDHNDPAVISMLALIHPGLIRKTVPIRVHK